MFNKFEILMLPFLLITVLLLSTMLIFVELRKYELIENSEQPLIIACILGSDVENLKECRELSK